MFLVIHLLIMCRFCAQWRWECSTISERNPQVAFIWFSTWLCHQVEESFHCHASRKNKDTRGHCSGTRYIGHILIFIAAAGKDKRKKFLLQIIPLNPASHEFPVPGFYRLQFRIWICFGVNTKAHWGHHLDEKQGHISLMIALHMESYLLEFRERKLQTLEML